MLTKKVSCLFSFSLWKGCLSIASELRTYFCRPPTINYNHTAAVPSVNDPQKGVLQYEIGSLEGFPDDMALLMPMFLHNSVPIHILPRHSYEGITTKKNCFCFFLISLNYLCYTTFLLGNLS